MENFTADGIYIDAPAERVFTALTDPQDALAWLDAAEVRIAPSENGEYSAQLENGAVIRGTISELSPPPAADDRKLLPGKRRQDEGADAPEL